jgi:hypothetical protein
MEMTTLTQILPASAATASMVEHCNEEKYRTAAHFDGLTRQMIKEYHQHFFELRAQMR